MRGLARKYKAGEAVALLLGLLLLALSGPRLWAYGTALPEDGRYWQLGQGGSLAKSDMAAMAARYSEAASRFPSSPELQNRAAIVSVEIGLQRLQSKPIREGRDRLVQAASMAPLRTDIWSRLAYAEFAAAGMTPLAQDALELSWLTGRLELPDGLRRLQTYLSGWDELPAEAREDAASQVALLWRARHAVRVAELYVLLGPKEKMLLRQLLPDPEADGRYLDYRVKRLSKGS